MTHSSQCSIDSFGTHNDHDNSPQDILHSTESSESFVSFDEEDYHAPMYVFLFPESLAASDNASHSESPLLSTRRPSTLWNEPNRTQLSTVGTSDSERQSCAPSVTAKELATARFASTKLLSPWFPEADPQHDRAQTFRTLRSRRDVVLLTCSTVAVITFLINLTCTIVFRSKWRTKGEITAFHTGSCSTIQKLDTGLHVVINVLSTLLLGASNLCMQLLVAPTRREIDKAHKRYVWLDIGVPSVRNLRYISRERLVVCVILGISSVPLHFV